MISLFRSLIAFALSLILTVLTFGRVEMNRTGGATAEDGSQGASRPAASRQLDDDVRNLDEETGDLAKSGTSRPDAP